MNGKGVKVKRSVTLAVIEEWSEGDPKQATEGRVSCERKRTLWSPRVVAAVITAAAALIVAVSKMFLS